jgi:hypothetical protein
MIDPLELHAYADGQLNQADEARVSQMLKQDAASRAEFESIVSLKKALQARCKPVECASEWKACLGRLDELDKSRRTESFVGRYAWGLCGAFFLFILAGGLFNRMRPAGEMQPADVARAAATLSPAAGPRSQEPREVAQYLDNLVGEASRTIAPERLRIVDGATGEVNGHRVAKLGLRDGEGELALIVINGQLDLSKLEDAPDPRLKEGKFLGTNSVAWVDQTGNTLILAGDRSYEELADTVLHRVIR